ncbi:hypothetical protein CLAFUW4_09308 [Fulvia fulva]|uniref:C2H2-type domain-containing protein n=1 Tax=Passalora fulva TaxID=5499 RepID=A0A9Q8PFB4_PASFU|nr:uncharacterized protein CLAFUR5_09409 [Fulvia fulva]KAK4613288.1 hypothetical protein CLAFUR4_09314 [Fulvia fulva]KAK4614277.1 hypothetical protein CLAFUR0_09306 [Fulvia fulva]UJO21420.1 hypothetical protein CLAFUR5_09409 [Fulvia fulva]WPV19856.1 hypothetical protein CLAFUW4_09308 [Fulvia fulva]WPV35049.1 hypothetical protein CLAFUW7_09309 [Fulvia fulva]
MSSGNDDYSRDASHTNRDHEGEGPEHGDTRDTKSPARTVNKEWNDLLDHDWDSFFTWGPDVGSLSGIQYGPSTGGLAREPVQTRQSATVIEGPPGNVELTARHKTNKICAVCSWTLRYPKDLVRHQKTHSKARLFYCPHEGCEYASKGFLRKDSLNRHIRKVHSSQSG